MMPFVTRAGPAMTAALPSGRLIPCLRAVRRWLSNLPRELRRADGGWVYELGDEVVFGQLHGAGGLGPDAVHAAVEGLSEVAEHALESARLREAMFRLALVEPRAVDLGLLLHGAALSRAAAMPREQGFAPALLLHDLVVDLTASADPAVRLAWEVLALRMPAEVARARAAAAMIRPGFGQGVPWPAPSEVAALQAGLRALDAGWDQVAARLHQAVAPAGSGATLAWPAVASLIGPGEPPRPNIAPLLDAINRPAQRVTAETRLRAALGWAARARAVLANLDGKLGWLRLYFAWLTRIVTGVRRLALTDGEPARVFARTGEVFMQDILRPIALGVDSFEGQPVMLFSTQELGWQSGAEPAETRRQRLRRQRLQCVSGALDVIDGDWIELLQEIGHLYFDERRWS